MSFHSATSERWSSISSISEVTSENVNSISRMCREYTSFHARELLKKVLCRWQYEILIRVPMSIKRLILCDMLNTFQPFQPFLTRVQLNSTSVKLWIARFGFNRMYNIDIAMARISKLEVYTNIIRIEIRWECKFWAKKKRYSCQGINCSFTARIV